MGIVYHRRRNGTTQVKHTTEMVCRSDTDSHQFLLAPIENLIPTGWLLSSRTSSSVRSAMQSLSSLRSGLRRLRPPEVLDGSISA